ncbi:MAG: hypothetical protein EKK55_18300 [Rhodocyclaceae bacterium]|nr:MAG: hypothetical protein EKK55_18300 [Rhodocyclaceae bacterium]
MNVSQEAIDELFAKSKDKAGLLKSLKDAGVEPGMLAKHDSTAIEDALTEVETELAAATAKVEGRLKKNAAAAEQPAPPPAPAIDEDRLNALVRAALREELSKALAPFERDNAAARDLTAKIALLAAGIDERLDGLAKSAPTVAPPRATTTQPATAPRGGRIAKSAAVDLLNRAQQSTRDKGDLAQLGDALLLLQSGDQARNPAVVEGALAKARKIVGE